MNNRNAWYHAGHLFAFAPAIPCRTAPAKNELGDLPAVPVLVHINKCPVLAQANTLRPEPTDWLRSALKPESAARKPAGAGESEYLCQAPFVPSEMAFRVTGIRSRRLSYLQTCRVTYPLDMHEPEEVERFWFAFSPDGTVRQRSGRTPSDGFSPGEP
jgi:hypothetical protein